MQKRQQQQARSRVRHDQEEHAGAARLGLFVLETHQAVGREGHDLPRDQEEEHVRGGEHQREAEQQKL